MARREDLGVGASNGQLRWGLVRLNSALTVLLVGPGLHTTSPPDLSFLELALVVWWLALGVVRHPCGRSPKAGIAAGGARSLFFAEKLRIARQVCLLPNMALFGG